MPSRHRPIGYPWMAPWCGDYEAQCDLESAMATRNQNTMRRLVGLPLPCEGFHLEGCRPHPRAAQGKEEGVVACEGSDIVRACGIAHRTTKRNPTPTTAA